MNRYIEIDGIKVEFSTTKQCPVYEHEFTEDGDWHNCSHPNKANHMCWKNFDGCPARILSPASEGESTGGIR